MAWIRQKPESEPEAQPKPTPQPTSKTETPPAVATKTQRETRMEHKVNIGQSVQIKGELSGNEDLSIEGMVDGKINLKDHNLTIGKNGKITAELHAKTVVIIGQVMGNVTADDKVEIHATGSVQGDIRAPRVAIADGAQFKGSIEMERGKSTSSSKQASKASGMSAVSITSWT
jgi:cytoskeletal protein CcmA (bactofilin family)